MGEQLQGRCGGLLSSFDLPSWDERSWSCFAWYCKPSSEQTFNSFSYTMSSCRTWIWVSCCCLCGGDSNNMDDLLLSSYLFVNRVSGKSWGELELVLLFYPSLEFTVILNFSIFLTRSFLSCWIVSRNFQNICSNRSSLLSTEFSAGIFSVTSIGCIFESSRPLNLVLLSGMGQSPS